MRNRSFGDQNQRLFPGSSNIYRDCRSWYECYRFSATGPTMMSAYGNPSSLEICHGWYLLYECSILVRHSRERIVSYSSDCRTSSLVTTLCRFSGKHKRGREFRARRTGYRWDELAAKSCSVRPCRYTCDNLSCTEIT